MGRFDGVGSDEVQEAGVADMCGRISACFLDVLHSLRWSEL